MNKIGFPISDKENENRRALVLDDIKKIRNKDFLYFESGYGLNLGYNDEDIKLLGCHVESHEDVLKKDVIVDPKIGDADFLKTLKNQTIFGWIHAVQNKNITDVILDNNLNVFAWEDMYENGRHVFWRNNEIAGEAAIMHAYQCFGVMPYNTKVALLGRGNTARGAQKILTLLGADVTVYTKKMEKLLHEELPQYDVIVNAILWDTNRTDHIIFRNDLKRMKKNSMIIDISCDRHGGIETSIPTTIDDPVYVVDGVKHYAVDHTPSLFYKTTSQSISEQVCKYIDLLCEEKYNQVLNKANCISNGKILDKRIIEFQNR